MSARSYRSMPPENAVDPLIYLRARAASKIVRYSSYASKFVLATPPYYVLQIPPSLTKPPRFRTEEEIEREERERQARLQRQMQALHAPPPAIGAAPEPEPPEPGAGPRPQPPGVPAAPFVREDRKVGRNEPCPCGSGKKYKHCHGALQQAGN